MPHVARVRRKLCCLSMSVPCGKCASHSILQEVTVMNTVLLCFTKRVCMVFSNHLWEGMETDPDNWPIS